MRGACLVPFFGTTHLYSASLGKPDDVIVHESKALFKTRSCHETTKTGYLTPLNGKGQN